MIVRRAAHGVSAPPFIVLLRRRRPAWPEAPPSRLLWPDHCVQRTPGGDFHLALQITRAELVIREGFRSEIDSYSSCYENERSTPTGLAGYLRERGFTCVVLCGLATDFCVANYAIDARRLGFETVVMLATCRGIDLGGSLAAALTDMREAGVDVEWREAWAARRASSR